MLESFRKFTDSTNFVNGVKITLAAAIPFIICAFLDQIAVGFPIALGALLTYPGDIPSNLSHKVKGVLVTAFIVAGCNLTVNLLFPFPYILYPVVLLLVFFLCMISVYGHRANMVSFSGLLSVCLSFSQVQAGAAAFEHSGLMLAGALFYLLISLLFYFIRPHRYAQLQLAECMRLTANYLKLRGDLWNINADRSKIIEQQLDLQVELNKIHDNIREILIRNRPPTGQTAQHRIMLLVFISLVEILELALSTSFDHSKLREKFEQQPGVLSTYQNLAYTLSQTLTQIAKSIESRKKYISEHSLTGNLALLESAIVEYGSSMAPAESSEGVLMLTNMMLYAEKQIEKIKTIRRAFTSEIDLKELRGRDKDLEKYLTPMYYPIATLLENFSLSSTIFRHSLRLVLTILISFIVGNLFNMQNVYWILLTLIVIMRPGYGLTKQRSFHRIFGTICGAVIAFAIISVVHNPVIIGVAIVICIILAYALTTTNYKVAVIFVTMYVVFIYSILRPNVYNVILYRIIDTLTGATLAFAANYLLWPAWEFLNLRLYLKKSIEANRNYLHEISKYYNEKGEVTTSYRLARKNAFIEIGNLIASFQRMSQEPKSKQKQVPEVYKLVVLNHTVLTAAASLGTYIQSHKTTEASEAFNVVVNTVIKNLENAIAILNSDRTSEITQNVQTDEIAIRFTELRNIREREIRANTSSENQEFELKMQEAQLVIEQLVWLTSLSENIVKSVKELQLD